MTSQDLGIYMLYTKEPLLLCFLAGGPNAHTIQEAYTISSESISSKINTLTAPDRLRLMRSLSTCEPGLWR